MKIIEILRKRGAEVRYHDPHVPVLPLSGERLENEPLTPATLAEADCVVIATDHTSLDCEQIVRHAQEGL